MLIDHAAITLIYATLANSPEYLSLVFSAETLPVLLWSEYLFAEETVSFRLKCSVVDGFRLSYFAS